MTDSATILDIRDIRKVYGTQEVLKGISLQVGQGETVSIIGPSGSGKTTFIRTLNDLAPPTSGRIELDGEVIFQRDANTPQKGVRPKLSQIRKMGMVFQQFNLFPHKTALQNVTLAPLYHHMGSKKDIELEALSLLDKVGLLEHAYKHPHQLSGGQQQRVAIARALAMHPAVMLFDEPTSALDPELVGDVLATIRALANEGMTMIIVTHEMQFAYRISDKIMFLEQGRARAYGSPDEVFKQHQNERLTQFLQDFNISTDGQNAP